MKTTLSRSDLILYKGDALVIPCYPEMMHRGKYAWSIKKILEEAGSGLIRELSALGELEMCHVCLTEGYNLPVKHLIFYACYSDNPEVTLTHLDWHETLKNVFSLVQIYKLKKIGVKLPTSLGKAEKGIIFRIQDAIHPKAFESEVLMILDTVMKSTMPEEKVDISLYL